LARNSKKTSRSAEREKLFEQAFHTPIAAHYDVCVIGGGAAGLAAAITSAEAGASTLVLEDALGVGTSILKTGNGRCNLSNVDLAPSHYYHADFVSAVVGDHFERDVLEFMAQSGLLTCEEEGRIYPLSKQAASVRSVLINRAQRAGATLAPARSVFAISPTPQGFDIHFNLFTASDRSTYREEQLSAACVIVTCGGGSMASPLERLGLKMVPWEPVLCPLAVSDRLHELSVLDGRRTHAAVGLTRHGKTLATETGEILFRPYGLSGIAIFNISRHAQRGDQLHIDLVPHLSTAELMSFISSAQGSHLTAPSQTVQPSALDGILDPRIAEVWLKKQPESSMPHTLADMVNLIKDLTFTVDIRTETSHAQVMRGGVSLACVNTKLEAHNIPGLFLAGEVLDVDGDCGGYNLAWAWKSGMVAGSNASLSAGRGRKDRS
jgi:predicted Rossmann fold flavoprotein